MRTPSRLSAFRSRCSLFPVACFLVALIGCRGTPKTTGTTAEEIGRLVDSLQPAVEKAVGLPFKTPPQSQLVTRDQVREYLLAKVHKEFPEEKLEGVQAAYRLLHLIPDSLDLKTLILDLYAEQVAGYYDPDSSLLYAVQGADRTQLRLIMAHELVHALQHQYLPLDSVMVQRGNGDRLAAAQAVLEGHATLASLRVLVPDPAVLAAADFWETYRDQVRNQQQTMPVFSQAPLVLKESLIFPYLGGAEFMRWWEANRQEALPIGAQLPLSTEQVLHPGRYAASDVPLDVAFPDSSADVMYEDTLGELEIQILLAVLRGGSTATVERPIGWGGDRYRVVRTPRGPALEWITVWDTRPQADRFREVMEGPFAARARQGYLVAVSGDSVGGKPGVRVTHRPSPE
ncbi:MAG TPA: hypothetical protein VF862_03760 [Gemmatimonadales bacterium]